MSMQKFALLLALLASPAAAECAGSCERIGDDDEVALIQHSLSIDKSEKAEIGSNASASPGQKLEPVQLLLNEIEFELSSERATTSMKSKVALAVLEGLALPACCGIDRCFMGQTVVGIIKGVTLGGLGIWMLIDYVVILINMLSYGESIHRFGFAADFEPTSINTAFVLSIVFLALKILYFLQKLKKRMVKMPSDWSQVIDSSVPLEVEPQTAEKVVGSVPDMTGGKPPDFNGKWLMTAYEGDADQFMCDVGIGWAVRTQAISEEMGAHKMNSEFMHDLTKNTLAYVNTSADGKKTPIKLKINGKQQLYVADGVKIWATPMWTEGGQKIKVVAKKEQGLLPTLERWLSSPEEMRVRLTTAKGSFLEQVFSKQ
mmetsp:Transcript_147075/g.268099  ORF Transcript_147075/g.268099 Transcript_147075/m.268099 type:complete len:373 (-) Transcript_147075:52-1170(-)